MATKTKARKRAGAAKKTSGAPRRKPAAKPSANGHAKASTNGKAKIGGSKDDPRQTYLKGTEPLKVPAIDAQVARYADLTTSRKSAKEMSDDILDNIVKLMKDNKVSAYRSNGKLVTVVEGQTVCKIKKASDK